MSTGNLSNPFPCLLCQGLLPPGNEGIITKHVTEQHNVFSRVEFIIMASKLMVEEVEQVEHLMEHILLNRDDQKVSGIEPYVDSEIEESESIDNEEGNKNTLTDTTKTIKEEEVKSEPKKKGDKTVFLEEKSEDILSNSKRKRMRVKASVVEGSCKCPICNKDFFIVDMDTENEYKKHAFYHKALGFRCECNYDIADEWSMRSHVYTAHRGSFHCVKCRKVFDTDVELSNHEPSHLATERI